MIDYRVYLVTDDPSRYRRDWLAAVEAALDGGVTCVQYRDTENPEDVQYERIRKLQDILRPWHIPLVVNNNAHLAAAVRAEGVHVGQGDMPPAQVRQIVGSACEIGLSITSLKDLESAFPFSTSTSSLHLISCLGIGPVFDARKTKADASAAIGPEGLKEIVAHAHAFPNCAIGGITAENAPAVLAAGAKGLALVSALSQAPDPTAAAKKFRALYS